MKKPFTIFLAVLVFSLALVGTAAASTEGDKAAKHGEKVKAGIQKLGTGRDSRIEVQLNDGTKVKGYVSEIKDGSFVVVSDGTNAATEIPYPNAKKWHKASTKEILIVVGAVVAAIVIIGLVFGHRDCVGSPC